MRDLLLLWSGAAGGTGDDALEAVRGVLGGRLAGVAPLHDDADRERALDRLGDALPVVAGGDGSLHHVVGSLHRRGGLAGTPLGLIPLGTGNDLARTLGIPYDDPAAAARALLTGRARPLDLLVSGDGGVALNAAHAGVGGQAALKGARLKRWLGAAAFRVGSVVAGLTARGWRLTVEVDGKPLVSDTPLLMAGVGNGRTVGGGTPLFPDADPADGLLDVVVSADTGALARAGYALALRRGAHLDRPAVCRARGREVRVRGVPVPLNVDGEVTRTPGEWSWRVEPGAWQALVPAEAG